MSLRRSLLPSIRAIHPALFLVGLALAVVQTGLSFGLAFLEATIPSVYGPFVTLGGPFLVFVVTVPFAVAVYQPVRDRTDSSVETLASAARGVRRLYPRVLAATVVAVGVALVAALAVTLVVFVMTTLVQYARYATGDPGPPSAAFAVWLFPLVYVAALLAGILVTRFADVFAAFDDADPWTAWRSSAAFARREPLSFTAYAATMLVLLGTPQVLQYALGQVDEVIPLVAAVGAIAVVAVVGLVLASALHVTYYERTVGPAVRTAPLVTIRWTRVAVVAVILLAAVAGAGYVRAVDAGAGQAEIRSLPDDPEAAYAVAAANTRDVNHRRTVLTRNESASGSEFRTVSESAIDYDDRRFTTYHYGEDPDLRVGGFQGEGTIAMPSAGAGSWRDAFAPVTRERNGWTVVAAPGYGLADPSHVGPVPTPGDDWPVESSNESTVVYAVTDPDAVAAAAPQSYYGMHGGLAEGSSLRVVVDRERGVVDLARFRFHSRETGHVYAYEMRYSEVGTAHVERPGEIGDRSPLEWAWDVLYY